MSLTVSFLEIRFSLIYKNPHKRDSHRLSFDIGLIVNNHDFSFPFTIPIIGISL